MSERTRGDAASIDAFLRCPEVRSFLFYFFFFPLSTLLKLLCIAFHRAALPPSIVSPPRSRINFHNTRGYRANYIRENEFGNLSVKRERKRKERKDRRRDRKEKVRER